MIDKILLEKYNMTILEDYIENIKKSELCNDEVTITMDWYKMFLEKTDYVPNKIIEELIEDLATATALEFISIFLDFIKKIRNEYQNVLSSRKFAREEINRLEIDMAA